MFSVEALVKFKGFLLHSLSDFELVIVDDYKVENKIEQMSIFCHSESLTKDKLQKLDHLCEDICSISHYSQTLVYILSFTGQIVVKENSSAHIKKQVEDTIKEVKSSETKHNNYVHELIGSYITFEKSLLNNRIRSILEADDKTALDDLKQKYDKEVIVQRELVEEVFYVYQK